MTQHAPSDVRLIRIPDGCGVPHERGANEIPWALTCPPCETAGARQFEVLGWSSNPGGVRLTCDEMAQAERDEKQAQRAGWHNMAGQMAQAAAQPVGPTLSLLEQIARMGPEEKDALRLLLGGAPAAAAQPVESAPAGVPTVDAAVASAKRTTRKTPAKTTA